MPEWFCNPDHTPNRPCKNNGYLNRYGTYTCVPLTTKGKVIQHGTFGNWSLSYTPEGGSNTFDKQMWDLFVRKHG